MDRLNIRRPGLLALALVLSSCRTAKPGDQPTVRYGTDTCARCGMIVSEERFAAGYVDAKGRSVVYDDLGELLAEAAAAPALGPVAFVHDAADGRWVKAAAACFVRIPALATPMGSGFAAFANGEGAAAFASQFAGAAPVMSFEAAVTASREAKPAG